MIEKIDEQGILELLGESEISGDILLAKGLQKINEIINYLNAEKAKCSICGDKHTYWNEFYKKELPCPNCGEKAEKCPYCDGFGQVVDYQDGGQECPKCNGIGKPSIGGMSEEGILAILYECEDRCKHKFYENKYVADSAVKIAHAIMERIK